jgi:CRP/FNR family cyclic AMP-dependent transcriptional regulator
MTALPLDSLPPEARQAALEVFRPRQVDRGLQLCYPGAEAQHFFFVAEGWVRLFQLGNHHDELTLTVVSAGDVFGEESLLHNQHYNLFAEPLTPVQLWVADQRQLRHLSERYPSLQHLLIRLLLRRLQQAATHLHGLRFREVLPRLAQACLAASRPGPDGPEVTLSHQDLAYLAGSTRETVTKALGELAFRQVIEPGYRRLLVLDTEGLHRIAQQNR